MAWKEMSVNVLAKALDVNPMEVREKQKLIQLIVKTRKKEGVSQATLAKKVGVTQSRIAQIESGVGTAKVTFDILLNVLNTLGYEFKIEFKKAA
ncbi:MAG: helix-turn-helix domain-containing protein [Deltaproteobacteria bacterium]|nr:helix-turn-helix domain-containing protein [Deltaproteobacteria bacterium]